MDATISNSITMYDTNKEPSEELTNEAIYNVWIVFKAKQPIEFAQSLERMIAETIKLIPTVGRVMVELKDKDGRE